MTSGFPGAGAGGNFLEQLLGDLLGLMGGAGSGDRTELARNLAEGVAGGGQPEANVDPLDRIRFEELMRVADMHVSEATGLSTATAGSAPQMEVVGPGTWARRTVEEWRFLLDAMTSAAPGAPDAAATLPDAPNPLDSEQRSTELMARFMATMGPMMAALQLGSAVGHLARTTLGQYEVPIPRRSRHLLVVSGNVTAFAQQWELPVDEVRLWVCLRELTTHAVLTVPHVAGRVSELITDVVTGMASEAAGLLERLQGADLMDPDAFQQMLSDPEALFGGEPSPQRARASAELMAAVAALAGYVEHVVDVTGSRLLGGRGALTEAWRRRQVTRESSSRSAEMLFGLDLDPAQTDKGVTFVRGVVERAGEDALAKLWRSASTLPTPSEIEAPGLWLERISYEELPSGE